MEKLLTVVIPAYNAEDYLSINLNSLLNEGDFFTYEGLGEEELKSSLEILIIDDGSTDSTGKIADFFEMEHPQIVRAIHKENGGHGSAINTGIQSAGGKYYKVIDSDDWVDPEAFAHLIRYLKYASSDIVATGFYWRLEKKGVPVQKFPKRVETEKFFEGVEYKKEYKFDNIAEQLYLKMHNLAIRTSILQDNDIHIDEHRFYVDTEYILFPIPYVETICFLPDFVYQYRIGRQGQSMSREKMTQNAKQYRSVQRHLLDFYRDIEDGKIQCTEEKKRYIERILARVYASYIKLILLMPASTRKRKYLLKIDDKLLAEFPEVHRANINQAVQILRKTRFLLTWPASVAVKAWPVGLY